MVEIMKADRFDNSGPAAAINSHPLAVSNPGPGISRAPMHPPLPSHQHHSHHPGQNSTSSGGPTASMSAGPNHQGSPLQRPPSTINHQGVSLFGNVSDLYL